MMQKNKKSRTRWVVIGIVAIIVAIFAAQYWFGKKKSHIVYHSIKVGRGTVSLTILSTGTVAPENRIDLEPPVAGRVEKVLVEEGQKVKTGQVLAYISSTERAALIDTAKSQGKAELAYWEDAYKMTPILAPTNGLIILKNSDTGQSVTQTSIILSMSDRLIVKVNVDESDLAQIKIGQLVSLVLDAFPNNPMPAKVVHIGYDAKTVNNVTTYEVDVLADQTPDYMKSGMTANATFLVDEKDDVLRIPASAVHRHEKASYVMVPNPNKGGEPIEKTIETGLSDGKRVEVVSGLSEGDEVLIASLGSFGKGGEDKNTSPFSPFGSRPSVRH